MQYLCVHVPLSGDIWMNKNVLISLWYTNCEVFMKRWFVWKCCIFQSMAYCNTVVSLFLSHCRYCSLALNHRNRLWISFKLYVYNLTFKSLDACVCLWKGNLTFMIQQGLDACLLRTDQFPAIESGCLWADPSWWRCRHLVCWPPDRKLWLPPHIATSYRPYYGATPVLYFPHRPLGVTSPPIDFVLKGGGRCRWRHQWWDGTKRKWQPLCLCRWNNSKDNIWSHEWIYEYFKIILSIILPNVCYKKYLCQWNMIYA